MYMLAGGGEEEGRGAGRWEQEQEHEQDDDRRPSGAEDIYHPLHAMQKTAKSLRGAPENTPPPSSRGRFRNEPRARAPYITKTLRTSKKFFYLCKKQMT